MNARSGVLGAKVRHQAHQRAQRELGYLADEAHLHLDRAGGLCAESHLVEVLRGAVREGAFQGPRRAEQAQDRHQ